MKTAVALMAILLAGCMHFNNVGRGDLPEPWRVALRRPATVLHQFSGTYSNVGQEMAAVADWDNPMRTRPQVIKGHLASVLSADARTGIHYEPSGATTVELGIRDKDKVELIARSGTTVIAHRTFDCTWDMNSGALVLLDDVKTGTADGGIAAVGHQLLRLFKGADGALYVQHKRSMAGTVLFAVPMATGEETWGRYPVAGSAADSKPDRAILGTVLLEFHVDGRGKAKAAKVIESSDPRYSAAAIDAISDWSFNVKNWFEQRITVVFSVPPEKATARDAIRQDQ